MHRQRSSAWAILVAVGLASGTAWSLARCAERPAAKEAAPAAIRIGMIASLFRDVPDTLVDAMSKPLALLISSHTGMSGEMIKAGDAANLGQQLVEEKVHLGIFHGFEFAWARQKYPQLKPLVLAINQQQHLRAYLLVRNNSEVQDFAGMKEKTLSLPKGTRPHCHLFLECRCQVCGQCAAEDYLAKIENSPNSEDALDDVVDGNVDATITDGVSLDVYKRRKPGRFGNLKIVAESEVFPAAVVAYHPGTLDEKTAIRFRDGLINTNKTVLGRQLLTLWKMTGFEPIAADYNQILTDIAKAYPPPEVE